MSGELAAINSLIVPTTNSARGSARGDASFEAMLHDAAGNQSQPADRLRTDAARMLPLERGPRFAPIQIPRQKSVPIERDSNTKSIPLRRAKPIDQVELRDSAKKLIASALLMPLLQEMDNSTLRPTEGPFAKSVVEKRFGPILHQHMADRMMQSGGRTMGLVDAVIKRMGGQSAATLEATA